MSPLFITILAALVLGLAWPWKRYKAKVLAFIKLWPEVYSLPVILTAWLISPWVLHFFDPVAATFDSGVLQIYIYAALGLMLFNSLVWMGIRLNFFGFFDYYKSKLKDEFINQLNAWQRIKALLFIYSVLLLCAVLLTKAL